MATVTVSKAQANLHHLIDQMANSHKPIFISGKHTNAVLISENYWNAIQETLYLLSIPNMRESIKDGLSEPIKSCSNKLD